MVAIYKLDDVLAYGYCGLKYRYRSWGVPDGHTNLSSVFDEATVNAIGAYLTLAADSNRNNVRTKVHVRNKALDYMRQELVRLKAQTYEEVGTSFMARFQKSMALLSKFDDTIDPRKDVVVHGRIPARVDLGEYIIEGDILGIISYDDSNTASRIYAVVEVTPQGEKGSSMWGRIRSGFAYCFLKQSLGDDLKLSRAPELLSIDPNLGRLSRDKVPSREEDIFVSLAKVACRGIESRVYPPQPSRTRCGNCSYSPACDLRYALPDLSEYHRKNFTEAMRLLYDRA